MYRVLTIPEGTWQRMLPCLFSPGGEEGFLYGLARPCRRGGGIRYVVEDLFPMGKESFDYHGAVGLGLTREASSQLNRMSTAAARFGLAPLHVHSHPVGIPDFSLHDNVAELELHEWLRTKGQPVLLSIVQSTGTIPRGRVWINGKPESCSLRIGLQGFENSHADVAALDRQRAFGSHFARTVADLRVAIVGVGGVGMPVAEQLARSGFCHFVLVDPDKVELTNLNRLAGLRQRDVGRYKVQVAEGLIHRSSRSIGTTAHVQAFVSDIYTASKRVRNAVGACDLILALTDDELSRITCLNITFQKGSEYLQAGVRIGQDENQRIDSITVEVTGAEVGRYCPICTGRLDPGQASLDARRYVGGHVWERAKADGYIPEERAPSIMSLNAVAAGALVLEIQKRVAGLDTIDLWQHDFIGGKTLVENGIQAKLTVDSCSACGRVARKIRGLLPRTSTTIADRAGNSCSGFGLEAIPSTTRS